MILRSKGKAWTSLRWSIIMKIMKGNCTRLVQWKERHFLLKICKILKNQWKKERRSNKTNLLVKKQLSRKVKLLARCFKSNKFANRKRLESRSNRRLCQDLRSVKLSRLMMRVTKIHSIVSNKYWKKKMLKNKHQIRKSFQKMKKI